MIDFEAQHQLFVSHPLPERLTQLATHLRQIADTARNLQENAQLSAKMRQCQYLINWTAAEFEPEIAAELVGIGRLLGCWKNGWPYARHDVSLRTLMYLQASSWAYEVDEYARELAN